MTDEARSSVVSILDKIRPMVNTLSPQERLALIQAIAAEETSDLEQGGLVKEQAAWFALPKKERQQFPGEYVAVREGKIIDHDKDQRALTLRVRAGYTPGEVLVVHSNWDEPPIYAFQSTQLYQGRT